MRIAETAYVKWLSTKVQNKILLLLHLVAAIKLLRSLDTSGNLKCSAALGACILKGA